MKWSKPLVFILTVGFVAAMIAPRYFDVSLNVSDYGSFQSLQSLARSVLSEDEAIALVGDVLLARDVEAHMNRNGGDYPYRIFRELPEYKAVVANFESAVPETHVVTPSFNVRFSTNKIYLQWLRQAGISHVSLANNHSFDFGSAGYEHTKHALAEAGIVAFGHPLETSSASASYLDVNDLTVGVLALNAVDQYPGMDIVKPVLAEVTDKSDLQVVYVHWGVEYEQQFSERQQEFAHALVDHGVDIVIGHHPHVVQGVERYQNGVIFYSLGNFIFDQYFSQPVQEGLLLELTVRDDVGFVNLVPVTSVVSRAQPKLMTETERDLFFSKLALVSESVSEDELEEGIILTQ